MANRRSSLFILFLLLLSFTLFTNSHPNQNTRAEARIYPPLSTRRQIDSTLNSTNTTNNFPGFQHLPKSLQDFIKLLGWRLQWFGNALSQATGNEVPPSPMLTDLPNLGSLVPSVTSAKTLGIHTMWFEPASSSVTSVVTVTSTRILTISRTRMTSPSSSSESSSTPIASARPDIMVYVGSFQGVSPTIQNLDALCQDPDIDIISLAAVSAYFGSSNLPVATFGALCNQTLSPHIIGLGDCSSLSKTLHNCQLNDKKIFIAIQVGTPTNVLSNKQQALRLASNLWDIYGAGKATASGAQTFGGIPINALGITFDGFDFFVNTTTISHDAANSNLTTSLVMKKRQPTPFIPPTLPYFSDLFAALRALFANETNKDFHISLSLPCTRPSILSKAALHLANFITVRFMDDPACSVDGFAFRDFLAVWGSDIASAGPSAMVVSSPKKIIKTTVVTSTRIHTATVLRPSSVTISPVEPYPYIYHPYSHPPQHRKRHEATPNFFIGLPAPSTQQENGTAVTGAGVADSATLSEILTYAKNSVPGFGGVMVWGGTGDLEINDIDGFLGFIRREVDGVVGNGTVTRNLSTFMISSIGETSTKAENGTASSSMETRSTIPTMTNFSEASSMDTEEVITMYSTRVITRTIYRSTSDGSIITQPAAMDFAERTVR